MIESAAYVISLIEFQCYIPLIFSTYKYIINVKQKKQNWNNDNNSNAFLNHILVKSIILDFEIPVAFFLLPEKRLVEKELTQIFQLKICCSKQTRS